MAVDRHDLAGLDRTTLFREWSAGQTEAQHADVINEGCRDRLAEAWRLDGVRV